MKGYPSRSAHLMATVAPPSAQARKDHDEYGQKKGVSPLRAGQGYEFLLRRLHSLSGIVPVGAFLFEHIVVSNGTAINGPTAYAHQVRFLGSLPFVFFLELFGIWLPIAFHGGYGVWIWLKAKPNLPD